MISYFIPFSFLGRSLIQTNMHPYETAQGPKNRTFPRQAKNLKLISRHLARRGSAGEMFFCHQSCHQQPVFMLFWHVPVAKIGKNSHFQPCFFPRTKNSGLYEAVTGCRCKDDPLHSGQYGSVHHRTASERTNDAGSVFPCAEPAQRGNGRSFGKPARLSRHRWLVPGNIAIAQN